MKCGAVLGIEASRLTEVLFLVRKHCSISEPLAFSLFVLKPVNLHEKGVAYILP